MDGISLVYFLGPGRPSEETLISALRKVHPEASTLPGQDSELLGKTRSCILEYLTGRVPLPVVPIDLRKGSPFDRKVWKAIEGIPFGKTMSYGQIAERAGSPGAARAAGGACGRNPVPILIPCHRVVAGGGKLGGFGGGLDIKRALLELEKSL